MFRRSAPRLHHILRTLRTFRRSAAAWPMPSGMALVLVLACSTVAQLASTGGNWPA